MTHDDDFFSQHLGASRLMVILRGYDPARTVELCERALEGGAGLVEVPVQADDAFPSLDAAVAWGARVGIPIGAGTVTTVDRLERSLAAGAVFTVAPGLDLDVLAESRRRGTPHLPGVATPTEVQTALATGATWLKVFPASTLGPGWVSAIRGPFPTVRIVVTGGVDVGNAPAFLAAGAAAVSLGGSFADADPAEVRALSR